MKPDEQTTVHKSVLVEGSVGFFFLARYGCNDKTAFDNQFKIRTMTEILFSENALLEDKTKKTRWLVSFVRDYTKHERLRQETLYKHHRHFLFVCFQISLLCEIYVLQLAFQTKLEEKSLLFIWCMKINKRENA